MRHAVPFLAAALLAAPAAAHAQAPAAPATADSHLKAWADTATGVFGLAADFTLVRTTPNGQDAGQFRGTVRTLRPNLSRARFGDAGSEAAAEEYLFTGKAAYHFDAAARTVTEARPTWEGAGDHVVYDLIAGMKPDDLRGRFEVTVHKQDDHYVYLDLKPRAEADRRQVQQARAALFGPATKYAYLPADVWVQKPDGGSERWKFDPRGLKVNPPGLNGKEFVFEGPPEGWTLRR